MRKINAGNIAANQNGYSLVELIVAMQLLVLVFSFIYLIYHYSHKTFVNWDRKNDILRSEILINTVLSSRIRTITNLEEIRNDRIIYYDDSCKLNTIYWTSDSLYLNSHVLKKNGVKITVSEIKYYYIIKEGYKLLSFEDMDLNNDQKVKQTELYGLTAFKIKYTVNNYSIRSDQSIMLILNKAIKPVLTE